MSSAITIKKSGEARFGWPPPSNKYTRALTKTRFIDTFHAQPPPSYNSVVRNATKSGNENGSVGSLSSTGSSQPKIPQRAEPATTVVAQPSAMSLLPSVLCGHVKRLIKFPSYSSSLPRPTNSAIAKPLERGSKSISSSSISQIPVLASGKAKLNHGVKALINAKERRIVNKSQSLEPKGCNEVNGEARTGLIKFARINVKRVVTLPSENGDPRPNKGVHPGSTSSSTCSCSSSPTQEHVPSPNTTNLQRRYSITIGSNCDPNHRSNNSYECDVDDIFSASDSEAAVSGSPSAMSSRARLRRRVEMGAALDGLPPPSGTAFQQQHQAQQRKLNYQDLPLCDGNVKSQLPRPPLSSATTPTTSHTTFPNNSRTIRMTQSGPHNCIPLPTNCKSSLHNHPPSTPHSMTSKHLRIRQRIPLTNPRMAPTSQVMPEQMQKPVICGRGSSSSSNSICSGSTSTTYKTTVGSTEYGSVGSGNSSSTPSSNGCQQFPIFTPVNIAHNQADRMNTGVKSSDSYQQHHQLQVVSRQVLGVSHGECGKREASPYDVPPNASADSDMKRAESSTTYRLLVPMVDNNKQQSCSSSSITNPAAGNGSYSSAGSSVSNQSHHTPRHPTTTQNNNNHHPSNRLNNTSHTQMPSSTTTMASNNNSTANAEKFLLQQQLKKLNQHQNGVNYQLNIPDKSASDRWSGGEMPGQSHQILVQPTSRNGSQVYSSSIEDMPISKRTGVDTHKPHQHHHHRQNSHQKRTQKSTEFPVLINGQLPQSSAIARDEPLESNTDLSGFPSSNSSQLRAQSAKKEVSPRSSASSRLSMPVVMTTPKVIKVPSPVVVSLGETNGHKISGHKLSSASKLLEAVKKTSVQKQDLECLPYNTLVNDDAAAACSSSTTNGQIVAVRMSAENQRQFDLGVTGGSDLSHPAIVSRINATNGAQTQPISFIPLNEGDQLLKINGRDIDKWTQAEVQGFLKELKSTGSDILLHIKPNVYRCCSVLVDDEDTNSQTSHKKSSGSALATVGEAQHHVADSVPRSDKLAQSLVLLKEAVENGQVVKQFEQLYRKKPGMSMDDSKLPENAGKNRYRDVCPYDLTRVLLKESPNGNYINACHVNMEIPCSGIVNRYIATQGPLPNTTIDFWHMVWEQSATTIAMLTTLLEKGRVKCHQYWPDQPKETMDLGSGSPLQITNMSEKVEAYCHYRELAIRHKITREERLVTQMQYTAWPDHGVPENPQHFIEFVNEVRKARNGSLDPLIVHCSAGIGRTGVLILMETSACQIEANEPVYPLDSMRLMRDQRAMLIQTAEQYTFVCESILRAYNEQSVRPLAEYQKCR